MLVLEAFALGSSFWICSRPFYVLNLLLLNPLGSLSYHTAFQILLRLPLEPVEPLLVQFCPGGWHGIQWFCC